MISMSKFPRILSALRQEAGVSQREAAASLGISQALLSHYENGIREPGLSFVAKACDYYGVSADLLLGRQTPAAPDAAARPESALPGAEDLYRAVSVVLGLLHDVDNPTAAAWAEAYLNTAVYDLFRHMCHFSPNDSDSAFRLDERSFLSGVTSVDLLYTRSRYRQALVENSRQRAAPPPPITLDMLSECYPESYQSLLRIVQRTGRRIRTCQAALLQGTDPSGAAAQDVFGQPL